MLHDLYFSIGMAGTIAVVVVMMLTSVTWMVAVAGTVVQPMRRRSRVTLLAALTLFPPLSLGVVAHSIVRSRAEYRRAANRSRA